MEESFCKNFLYPYYRIASSFPQRLGQFYVEDRSIISRGNGGYTIVGKNTGTAILNPLPLGFSVADEPKFTLQPIYSEQGKLQWKVLVTGFLLSKEPEAEIQMISFSQSMLLYPEETESGRRYFILSDIFHAHSKPIDLFQSRPRPRAS